MKAATMIPAGSISPRPEIAGRSPSCVHEPRGSSRRQIRSFRMSIDLKENSDLPSPTESQIQLRRVRSETDLKRSPLFSSLWSPAMRFEEDDGKADLDLSLAYEVRDAVNVDCSGRGFGNGRKIGGGRGDNGENDANREKDRRIGNYFYRNMLKQHPANPLLLRNYGRFLHEVEGDLEKAEEYYGRAILMSPNDGDLLAVFGRLIWESQRDCKRAESFYKSAVKASPDDCFVMGAYAHFVWDADEEDEDDGRVISSSPLVEMY